MTEVASGSRKLSEHPLVSPRIKCIPSRVQIHPKTPRQRRRPTPSWLASRPSTAAKENAIVERPREVLQQYCQLNSFISSRICIPDCFECFLNLRNNSDHDKG